MNLIDQVSKAGRLLDSNPQPVVVYVHVAIRFPLSCLDGLNVYMFLNCFNIAVSVILNILVFYFRVHSHRGFKQIYKHKYSKAE